MIRNFSLRFLLVLGIWILSLESPDAKTLDHEVFLSEMESSSQKVYSQCISKYDEYLNKFPDDVIVHIEKCKFIQFAQYDDYEDYNPNQDEFDSCVANLVEKFPNNPDVFIFQTTYLWGDELYDVFNKAEMAIGENPLLWSKENLADLYSIISNYNYAEEKYQDAYEYIQKAIELESKHKSTIEYARILVELNRKEEALEVLLSIEDTSKYAWVLSQKADLLLQLNANEEAFELYKLIAEIDPEYNNNLEIANALEASGEYDFARSYLISDTSKSWNKMESIRKLLNHDLKYQSGQICIQTYNIYRDMGYLMDPMGLYRLKIFLKHPFQPVSFRDILSILTFILALIILIIVPAIWILPIYFVGHHWKFVEKNKSPEIYWGLKAFWFVSAGYLISSLLSVLVEPETIYTVFNSSYYDDVWSDNQMALATLIFILFFAVFGFASLYKRSYKVLLSNLWNIQKSILVSIGVLVLFRLVIGLYITIGVSHFGISVDSIANIPNILLASNEELKAVISSYGKLTGFLLVCILVPVYEEIIFRGVIFDACRRYTNFHSANIIQSLFFAAIHGYVFLFPVFFLFGILTGILRKNSGGLLPGIVFHICHNILAVLVLMMR